MNQIEYYAVTRGRIPGLFTDWESCCNSVDGFPGSSYRTFYSLEKAKEYLNSHGVVYKDIDMFLDDLKEEFDIASDYGIEELAYAINGGFNPFQPKMKKIVLADGSTKKSRDQMYDEALFGVRFGDHDERNIFGRVPLQPQTDQVADLFSIYTALKIVIDSVISESFDVKYAISTCSKYSIDCIIGLSDAYDTDQWLVSEGIPFEIQEILVDTVTLYDLLNLLYKNVGWSRMYILQTESPSDTTRTRRGSYGRRSHSHSTSRTRNDSRNSGSYYTQDLSDTASYHSTGSHYSQNQYDVGSYNGRMAQADSYYSTQNKFGSDYQTPSPYQSQQDRGKLSTALKYGNYYRKSKKKGFFANAFAAIVLFVKAIYYYRHYKKQGRRYKKEKPALASGLASFISNSFYYILVIVISVSVISVIYMFLSEDAREIHDAYNSGEYHYNHNG